MSMLLASGFGSIAMTSTVSVVGVVEKPGFPPIRGAGFWCSNAAAGPGCASQTRCRKYRSGRSARRGCREYGDVAAEADEDVAVRSGGDRAARVGEFHVGDDSVDVGEAPSRDGADK